MFFDITAIGNTCAFVFQLFLITSVKHEYVSTLPEVT